MNAKCQAEMQDFATQLFADYKLNPEVVAHCEKALEKDCRDQMKAEGGALDCLMSLADQLDKKCYEAVSINIFSFACQICNCAFSYFPVHP